MSLAHYKPYYSNAGNAIQHTRGSPSIFNKMAARMDYQLHYSILYPPYYGYTSKSVHYRNKNKTKNSNAIPQVDSKHFIFDINKGRRNSCLLPPVSKTVSEASNYKLKNKRLYKELDNSPLLRSIDRILKQIESKAHNVSAVNNAILVKQVSPHINHQVKSCIKLDPIVAPILIKEPVKVSEMPKKPSVRIPAKVKKNPNIDVIEVSPWDKRAPSSRCSLLSGGITLYN